MTDFKNKPLIEAVFELNWTVDVAEEVLEDVDVVRKTKIDPYYKILFANIFKKRTTGNDYPVYEELAEADIPEDQAAHVVQHRFFSSNHTTPIFQFGPGVITVNLTSEYTWIDFNRRIQEAVDTVFSLHPAVEKIKFTEINLRYINSIEFDFSSGKMLDFLKENLKINIALDDSLFEDSNIVESPISTRFNMGYFCEDPKGMFSYEIGRALIGKENKPCIMWELEFTSQRKHVPQTQEDIEEWALKAHRQIDLWFRKSLSEDLERRFQNG